LKFLGIGKARLISVKNSITQECSFVLDCENVSVSVVLEAEVERLRVTDRHRPTPAVHTPVIKGQVYSRKRSSTNCQALLF